MSYKTILVHAAPDAALEARVRGAASLGARFGATLIGVGAVAWDPYVDPALGYVDGATLQALRNDVDTAIEEARVRFRAATADYMHPVLWQSSVAYPEHAMAAAAAEADLVVACRPPKDVGEDRFAKPEGLIMRSGLPVLTLASEGELTQPRTVLIAWKDTRESRRAVTDALPILKAAERVMVVAVTERGEAPAADGSAEAVAKRLERHGATVTHEALPQLDENVSEDLLDIAAGRKADLIVMGAYGHSRLREWAFGGVTADLLRSANRPVLFSR